MDTDHDTLITEFCGITASDPDTARSALESTNWNINEAVTFFFAARDQPAEPELEDEDEDEDDDMADDEPQRSQQPQRSAPRASGSSRPTPGSSRLRTIRDLQRSQDEPEDDDQENPDLFTGGEKSGLAVQDPNKPSDHFNNIIQQAQQNRPRPVADDEEEEPARPSFFSGRGQTLGGDDAPSTVIEDPRAAAASQAQNLPRVSRTLHLWQDGFSIDDGELYRFDDPANAHTLALINSGRAPLALLGVQPGQEVDLQLNPHREEKYVQPKQKYKPFSGGGQRLGSPTPGPSGTVPAQPAAAGAPASATSASATASSVDIDESQPTVRLQIRLGDGSRLQSTFNTTHTIGDVHNYINSANQASSSRAYALMTTFPSKELSDKSIALGDLPEFKRGGVIVQKWT